MLNLGKNTKVTPGAAYADGTADVNGATLDMSGYDGVLMILTAAAIAGSAVTTFKAQQGAESNLSDAADLEGTGISVADDDDDQLFIIDLYRPQERYVRAVIDKDAANTVAASILYIQYNASRAPVTQNVTDEVTYELHVSPDEGTA